jgi:hypothetical protein
MKRERLRDPVPVAKTTPALGQRIDPEVRQRTLDRKCHCGVVGLHPNPHDCLHANPAWEQRIVGDLRAYLLIVV